MTEADPLRRRQQKELVKPDTTAPAQAEDDELLALDRDPKPKKKDRLDYSRFNGIGEDSKSQRTETGDITWDDLNLKEKKDIFQHEEKIQELLDKKRHEEDEWKRQLREKP